MTQTMGMSRIRTRVGRTARENSRSRSAEANKWHLTNDLGNERTCCVLLPTGQLARPDDREKSGIRVSGGNGTSGLVHRLSGAWQARRMYTSAQSVFGRPTSARKCTLSTLTLEHAPPERMGGKAITVTCRKCNNAFGAGPDAAAAQLEQFRDYFMSVPGSRMRGGRAFSKSGAEVRVQSSVADDGSHIAVPVGRPSEVDAFVMAIEVDGGFAVLHPIVDVDEEMALSHLKSAYLLVFAKLGYTWAMCDKVAPIRHPLSGRFPSAVDPTNLVNGSRSGSARRILVGGVPLFGFCVQFDEFVTFSRTVPPRPITRAESQK